MQKPQSLFFSCVESRIQDQGSLYARFHIGTFFRGQALTFGNALRRTLLSEIPGIVLSDVVIDGASHEFATLPGVRESILEILLNLQKLIFAPCSSQSEDLKQFKAQGVLKVRGPGKFSAADIKLPLTIKSINPKAHLVTLTTGAEFCLRFTLSVQNPQGVIPSFKEKKENFQVQKHISAGIKKKNYTLFFENVTMPVQKVNYVIKSVNAKQGSEYLVVEIWTDGSVLPSDALDFALKNVTILFYQFASVANLKMKGRLC